MPEEEEDEEEEEAGPPKGWLPGSPLGSPFKNIAPLPPVSARARGDRVFLERMLFFFFIIYFYFFDGYLYLTRGRN